MVFSLTLGCVSSVDPRRASSPSISINLHCCFFISKALQCSIEKHSRPGENISLGREAHNILSFKTRTLSPRRDSLAQAESHSLPRLSLAQATHSSLERDSQNFQIQNTDPLAWARSSRLGEILSLKRESGSMPHSSGLLPNFKEDKFGILAIMNQNQDLKQIKSKFYKKIKGQHLKARKIILDHELWRATDILKVFEPIVKVLRLVDGDTKPNMSFLYEAIDRGKQLSRPFFRPHDFVRVATTFYSKKCRTTS
ncbi:hypothetical protein Lal_00021338 [Lupinus albus]|nr:hypothetical protein Lal_00021338 [Lupinus albus]